MATRTIPATKILVCDICLREQLEQEATAPFGGFTYRSSVTLTKTRMLCEVPLKFDTCNDCQESVGRYVSSLLAVARAGRNCEAIPPAQEILSERENLPGTDEETCNFLVDTVVKED